jgi:membrane protease YdiL (CAAX protease family)
VQLPATEGTAVDKQFGNSGIIAALIGLYSGLLWIWTGNLITPMITHAAYDFVALVYFLRLYRAK